jgi:hypothetical protein
MLNWNMGNPGAVHLGVYGEPQGERHHRGCDRHRFGRLGG